MSERFYVPQPLTEGAMVELEGAEAHHLATVCRLGPGDAVYLFNGDGNEYAARVLEAGRHQARLEVTARAAPPRELPFELEVAAPLPRGDRARFLVEKLTELGARRLTPLATRRSVVQPRETRREKLQRYIIEASKQCGRNRLMEIGPFTDWPTYCTALAAERKVLAHPGGSAGNPAALAVPAGASLAVVVGPEGGFTDEEIELARSAGWQLLDLGPRILRVETAALVLASWAVAAGGTDC
jgi:16S rRNA (uracil1498-N3)-methyltransferase